MSLEQSRSSQESELNSNIPDINCLILNLVYFQVDVAIMEVNVGGTYDCSNIHR